MTNEQLAKRRLSIGASEAAAVLGLNPWCSPFKLYQIKRGEVVQEENEAMSYGLLVEPAIRQWYANYTGLEIVVPEGRALSGVPFVTASPDGITSDGRGLEIKTTQHNDGWGEPGTDQIPVHYTCQVQQQMLVFHLAVVDVVVSIRGRMPVLYTVLYDEELATMIVEANSEFWNNHVLPGIPPDPLTYEDVLARYKTFSRSESVIATQEAMDAYSRLLEIKNIAEALEKEENDLKAILMRHMGNMDTLLGTTGKVLATWKMSKNSQVFDAKRFQDDHPELIADYMGNKPGTRRFLLKGGK